MSDKLGGRSEVLDTPFLEVLGHLDTKLEEDEKAVEKEQMEYYLNFVAMLNSNPQNDKQSKQTEKFMKEIKPDLKQDKGDPEVNKEKYQWPERVRKKMEAKQREQLEE